jgi:hypothetical protein
MGPDMTILRWFHYDGVRHRVYYRGLDRVEGPQLVVAGPDWERTIDARVAAPLDQLSEADLIRFVQERS